jgi:WD40 repeat protein
MLRSIVAAFGCVLLTAAVAPGQAKTETPATPAAPPPPPPVLALDAGGHTAMVRKVLFTPDGKELISVGEDKAVRFWDVASGESHRMLRPPVGWGPEGKLYAAALSPDGSLLAIGGRSFTGAYGDIHLISVATGEMQRVLRGHPYIVNDLIFFPDGKRLLSGAADGTTRLFDVSTGACLQTFSKHTTGVFDLALSPDGLRCATGSSDMTAAVWDVATGERLSTLTGHTADVKTIDWSPTEDLLVTGGLDGAMRLWKSDGTLVRTIDNLGPQPVTAVHFTRDGQRFLYTKELDGNGIPGVQAGLINVADGQVAVKFDRHNNSIIDGNFSVDGELVATTGGADSEIYIWKSASGEFVSKLVGQGKVNWTAAWSPDGKTIGFGNSMTGNSIQATSPLERSFDLEHLEFGPSLDPQSSAAYRRHQIQQGVDSLVWVGRTAIEVRRNGEKFVTLQPADEVTRRYDRYRSQTFLSDHQVAIGSNFGISIFQPETGQVTRFLNGQTGTIWSVSPSPDGRYLLSTADDMTISIWKQQPEVSNSYVGIGVAMTAIETGVRIDSLVQGGAALLDGRLRPQDVVTSIGPTQDQLTTVVGKTIADAGNLIRGEAGTTVWLQVQRVGEQTPLLFELTRKATTARTYRDYPLLSLFFAGNEWIAWTPEGYYAASAGGERLMGWHVNNGNDKLASFYPAANFRKDFYRPDVIKLLLATGSVQRALELAGDEEQIKSIAQSLPPKIEITSPTGEPPIIVRDKTLDVAVKATQVGALPITSVQLLLNGRPLGGPAGVVKINPPADTVIHTFRVPLIAGVMQTLQARADNASSYDVSSVIPVTLEGEQDLTALPSMYVLSIGVSSYDDAELSLQFADDDARRIAETMQQVGKGLFRKVETKVLTDKDATGRGIKAGLGWLKQQMTQHDVAIVFFSGHGDKDETGGFYLLPCDVDRTQPLLVSGVADSLVKSALAAMPGRILVLLDACHAGTLGGDNRKAPIAMTDDLVRDLSTDDYGVVVMASSMGREFSLENSAAGSGNFTMAIIEGLTGRADFNQDASVYFGELDTYVSERVKELSKGRQHPVTAKPATIRSFPLGRMPR